MKRSGCVINLIFCSVCRLGWAAVRAVETAAVESVVGAAADTVAAPELSAQSVPDPGPVQTSHRSSTGQTLTNMCT